MKGSSHKEWLRQKEIEDQMLRQKLEIREVEKVKIDQRAENRRLYSRLHAERREAETEEKIIKANDSYALHRAQCEQEAKLAQEVDRIQREEMKQVKLRQKLRETSVELKQLEAQLRAAYVSKELSAQVAEKVALRLKEKLDEKKAAEFMRSVWDKSAALEAERESQEYQQKLAYRAELQDQIICDEKRKQIAYEDFLREKLLLDEVVRRIHEEDQREMESKMIKMKKTKEEVDAFHKARNEWKEKEKKELDDENRRIQEYLATQDEKEHERMEQQRGREEQKAINTERVARKLYEAELKRREEEEVILQMLEEEKNDEMIRKEQLELERQLRQRIEYQEMYRLQMKEKIEKLQKEGEEEAMFRKQLLEQYAESERLEQLTAEKRRIKLLEHRRAVSETLEERRKQRALEVQHLMHLQELEKQEEQTRKKLIEEERLRMLKEHAVKLIGYLPRGVLRQDDLPHLGSEFVEKCAANRGE